ncbi:MULTISPECIES: hypothetical protein [unclassified Thermoanaerobacterium]|uniref:hypothetical protein n=1 Tax=unclassified Thermoanaerobacterium TaxID=2622527 RepID=UPI00143B3D5D|nr:MULTISPECIES: hypothetical protein [unclassified Thermoanaerobacterium]MDE4542952.1 hypothetical protein [Thermoanaerobacterium sp. R66]HHV74508.1 hypothetical protein [Thermoanaerobacterium sp.]
MSDYSYCNLKISASWFYDNYSEYYFNCYDRNFIVKNYAAASNVFNTRCVVTS